MANVDALGLSRIRLRSRRETTYGVVDVGQPNVLYLNDEALSGDRQWERSGVAKANRLPAARRPVYEPGGGQITMDVYPGAQFEGFVEETLMGPFASALSISAATIAFAEGDNSLTGSGGTEFANVQAGQWITISGASVAANNTDGASGRPYGAFVVSKTSDAKIILAYHVLSDELEGSTVVVEGQPCRNGTTLFTRSYEREHTDASTDKFRLYTGQAINTGELTLAFNSIMRAAFTTVGCGPDPYSATSVWDGQTDIVEAIAKKGTDVSNNLRAFRANGSLTGNMRQFSFSLANNITAVQVGQQRKPAGQIPGTAGLTGTFHGYLVDGDERQTLSADGTPQDFHMMVIPDQVVFGAAPIYVVSVFECTMNEMGDVPKSANEGGAMLDFSWEADESSVYEDLWIQVTKLPTVAP